MKANLKACTVGLKEDCHRLEDGKLCTISSDGVGWCRIPRRLPNKKAPVVTPVSQGQNYREGATCASRRK